MKAEGKVPKHRIGPIKGFRSVAREMMRMGNFIGRHIGVSIESEDIRRAESAPDGSLRLRLKNTGAGSSSPSAQHPFYILQSTGELVIGTVNGSRIPTCGGDEIGIGGGALTLSGNGYVYVRAKVDVTFHATTHFMTSWDFQSAEPVVIIGSSTPLTENLTGNVLTSYKLIAQIVDGIVQRMQPVQTDLNFMVCDQSDGTGGGKAVIGVWTPA